jgi:hypothetical protein
MKPTSSDYARNSFGKADRPMLVSVAATKFLGPSVLPLGDKLSSQIYTCNSAPASLQSEGQ